MTEINEALELLKGDPAFQAAVERRQEERRERRREAAERLEQIGQEAAERIPALRFTVDMAQQAVQDHAAARKPLLETLQAAKAELIREQGRITRERSQAESVLRETADPAIDEAIRFFDEMFWKLKEKSPNEQQRKAGVDPLHLRRKTVTFSSHPSITAAMAYCREAVRELEEAKSDPHFDSQRIEELKAGIPDPDELVEFTSETGMKDVSDLHPRHRHPSDDHLQYLYDKAMETGERLLRKGGKK